MVLIVVLVIVAMLAAAGFTFNELMLTEHQAARLRGRTLQTDAALESAVELLRVRLDSQTESPGDAVPQQSGELAYRHVPAFIDEDTGLELHFTVLAPQSSNDNVATSPQFGVASESARLNLHALLEWEQNTTGAARDALMELPGMTMEAADSMLDWIDPDDLPRGFGAERAHYASVAAGIEPRNGVPEVIEELLRVRGVSAAVLLGRGEATFNDRGTVSASGARPASSARRETFGESSGAIAWSDFLTIYSREANASLDGEPRIRVNDDDLTRLHRRLTFVFDRDAADFIVFYRQFGPSVARESGSRRRRANVDLARPAQYQLTSISELIGARTAVEQLRDSEAQVIESPFGGDAAADSEHLPKLLDRLSLTDDLAIVGRIDVNLAAAEVLRAVPGLDPEQVQQIVSRRRAVASTSSEGAATAAWLVTEGIVTLEEMGSLERFVTGSGQTFRASVIAYHNEKGPAARAEVVVDAAERPARVVAWRRLAPVAAAEARAAFDSANDSGPRTGTASRRIAVAPTR